MFKKSSDSSQSRALRSVVDSRKNSAGVDPGSFRQGQTEESLGSRKKRILQEKTAVEGRLAALNHSIAQAKNNHRHNSPRQTGYDWLAIAASQRLALIRKVNWCQNQLAEIKTEELATQETREVQIRGIPDFFMELAEELLAKPVFDRVLVAAIHRQRGRKKD